MVYESEKSLIASLIEEINKTTKEDEKEKLSCRLYQEIKKLNKLFILDQKHKRKNLLEDMNARGIFIECSTLGSKALKEKWESIFAKNLTEEERKEIYFNQFLWHIFSYEKVTFLKTNRAREAFNNVIKDEVIAFYQNNNIVHHFKNGAFLKDTDFDSEDDLYIVDTNFQWTYVVTHEEQCGPYFFTYNMDILK
ncbi:DUF4275 family protein [Serpentinicella alkaliphila]|uniref:Uncharacterized protein DUF4275 n=1 Tax=Serpentinicella alkaliphila TaxID=1734049 RepID=A0A4V2T3Y8_9FIRM|nr:DUF4275 family protein [Serpentinicella alkaliphila]QUH26500.1 DUF4275 family protein [Serpentinicella alkaliphila]TCQ03214.1 uncharacterized protein DUF4275 [Serpentinicella alkaliphila]